MDTTTKAHPLARQGRRNRRLAFSLEVAVLAATVVTIWAGVVTASWSWWHLLPIAVIALLGTLVHLYVVVGFSLDENDRPITGRDADEVSLWKMRTSNVTTDLLGGSGMTGRSGSTVASLWRRPCSMGGCSTNRSRAIVGRPLSFVSPTERSPATRPKGSRCSWPEQSMSQRREVAAHPCADFADARHATPSPGRG